MHNKNLNYEERKMSVLINADNYQNPKQILNMISCPFENTLETTIQMVE